MHFDYRKSVWIILILLSGIALRVFHLDHSAIWLDEKISLAESNGSSFLSPQLNGYFNNRQVKEMNNLPNIINATIEEDGGNGILYIMKLHYWQMIFGSSDFSLRMLSLIFSCFVIVAAYYFSSAIFQSPRAALFAALLIAIHPLIIEHAQKVRPYSMALFFSFISSAAFYKIFLRKYTSALIIVIYVLCSLCALLSHYLTASIFLAQGFYFLLFVKEKIHRRIFVSCWLGITAAFTIWLVNGGLEGLHYMSLHNLKYAEQLNTIKEGDNMFILPANFKNIFSGWIQLLLAATGNTLQSAGFRLREISVLLIIPLLIMFIAWKKKDTDQQHLLLFLFLLAFSAPVYSTLLALTSGHTISFQPAYGIFAAPYIILITANACDKLISQHHNLLYKLLPALSLVLISTVSLLYYYSSDKRTYSFDQSNPLILVAEKIMDQTGKNDTILFPTYPDAFITNIYLDEGNQALQKVDTTTADRIILKNKNTVLFDFENGKYRY